MGLNTILQITIFIILTLFIIYLYKLYKSFKLKERFAPYSIKLIEDDSVSIVDRVKLSFEKFLVSFSELLKKSAIFRFIASIYDKIFKKYELKVDSFIHIAKTLLSGIFFVVIFIISSILFRRTISFLKLFSIFVIFSFLPNITLYTTTKKRIKEINEDMLQAIIVMNNAFKSGMSIMQAIKVVTKELDGEIKEEFNEMYLDISFGLNMDIVFERFANRINTKDARYIATSLSVLNKTGGDIVNVFKSVERSAFNRKKLEEELKAIAASASLMFWILIIIPLIMVVAIELITPGYFQIFFQSPIGMFLLMLTVSLYLVYVIIIYRIINKEVGL